MIIAGASSQSLAGRLASIRDEALDVTETRRFPDGEFLVELDRSPDRAIVVASTPTAESHVELLQLQDAAREAGASEVVTVLPYMGYARQDQAFRPGQPVSARAMARAISTATDRVILVNPHTDRVAEWFDPPARIVDASPLLADPLPEGLRTPLFLAPDAGATDLADRVRDAYGGGESAHFEKRRDRETGEVEFSSAGLRLDDRDIVVVDDMVATGRTVSQAVRNIDGGGRVYVACVHPVLAGSARTALAASGVEAVLGTDTLERPESAVSVAPVVADTL